MIAHGHTWVCPWDARTHPNGTHAGTTEPARLTDQGGPCRAEHCIWGTQGARMSGLGGSGERRLHVERAHVGRDVDTVHECLVHRPDACKL